MRRLLVLSALAAVIVTFPALAGARTTIVPHPAIGPAISGQHAAPMAAVMDLTLLAFPRDGTSAAQS